MDAIKERWFEAETNRIAGEIALKSPEPDMAEAERYFERALVVAHQQQAKAWKLRAAMSMARVWRDRASVVKPANSWLQSTAGSLRALIRST